MMPDIDHAFAEIQSPEQGYGTVYSSGICLSILNHVNSPQLLYPPSDIDILFGQMGTEIPTVAPGSTDATDLAVYTASYSAGKAAIRGLITTLHGQYDNGMRDLLERAGGFDVLQAVVADTFYLPTKANKTDQYNSDDVVTIGRWALYDNQSLASQIWKGNREGLLGRLDEFAGHMPVWLSAEELSLKHWQQRLEVAKRHKPGH